MIVVIVGPTGVGKTKMSIELAKYLDAPIFDTSRPQSKVEPCFFYIFTCVVSRSVL